MKTEKLKKRLASSLQRGTGEAYTLVRDNPDIDFSSEILHAACHNLAYDPQCEGDRGEYMYSIIELARNKDQIISSILSRLVKQKRDNYGLNQMCEIARLAHVNGFAGAREAILRRYKKNGRPGYTECGNYSVRRMEGIKALLLIADVIGQILRKNRGEKENSYVVDEFQKERPKINVWGLLRAEAKVNENVKAYLFSVQKNKWDSRRKHPRTPFTYQSVSELIGNKKRFSVPLALRDLPSADIEQLANDFLKESDRSRKTDYLKLFGQHKFPFGYAEILELARSATKAEDRLLFFAIQALSLFDADEVRQLFVDRLNKKSTHKYLPLLILNYKQGDHDLIVRMIKETRSLHKIHSIAADLQDIYEANPTPDCRLPIEAVYEKLNCGLHREYLINILIEQNVLSERLRDESLHDSHDDTRKLAAEIV